MPGIPNDLIDEVRDRTDILEVVGQYVSLRKRGAEFWACCPFHQEKTPSFKVSSTRQSFYCFGCRKGGNVFSFIQDQENLIFPEAVRLLAQRVGVHIPDPDQIKSHLEPLYNVLEEACEAYQRKLSSSEAAKTYLEQDRDFTPETISQWKIGWAPDDWHFLGERLQSRFERQTLLDAGLLATSEKTPRPYDTLRARIIFPIFNPSGRVIGFMGRTLLSKQDQNKKGTPKYMNTKDTEIFHKGNILYGLNFALNAAKEAGWIGIAEGQTDVISCHQEGLENIVCSSGTAFTSYQADLINKKLRGVEVRFMFDSDEAGKRAAARAGPVIFGRTEKPPKICFLPEDEDPDSLLRTNRKYELEKAIEQGIYLSEYYLENKKQTAENAGANLNTFEGLRTLVESIKTDVRKLPEQSRKLFLGFAFKKLGIKIESKESSLFSTSPQPPAPFLPIYPTFAERVFMSNVFYSGNSHLARQYFEKAKNSFMSAEARAVCWFVENTNTNNGHADIFELGHEMPLFRADAAEAIATQILRTYPEAKALDETRLRALLAPYEHKARVTVKNLESSLLNLETSALAQETRDSHWRNRASFADLSTQLNDLRKRIKEHET